MIKRLLTLNGFAIIGAVIHHTIDWVLTAMIWWADRYRDVSIPALDQIGSLDYYILRMIDQMAFFAVPAFLFISGFFVAIATKKNQRTISFKIVIQRIKYLLIPYLIWSCIILVFNIFLGQRYTLYQFVKALINGGVVAPFYFVPLLVLLYLFSPLFIPIAKTHWKSLLIVTTLMALLATGFRYDNLLDLQIPGPSGIYIKIRNSQFLANSIWFVLGIVVGFHRQKFTTWLEHNKRFLLFGVIATYIIGIIEWNIVRTLSNREWIAPQVTFVDQLFAILFIFSWLAFDKINHKKFTHIDSIGKKSYGIYLMHVPILIFSSKAIYHIAPWLLSRTFTFQAIIFMLGIGIPLLTMKIFEKTLLQPYYKYIFG